MPGGPPYLASESGTRACVYDGDCLTRPPARLTQVAVTYRVDPVDDGRCRLVVKLALRYAGGRATAWLFGRLWPWLELFMMQRQLGTLKQLAEAQAR